MEIYKKYGRTFLCPNVSTITKNLAQDIYSIMSEYDTIILDLEGVEDCSNEFFFILKNFEHIKLVNVESRVLSMLYVTGYDRYVKIFGEEVSLFDNRHELVNRKFAIV